MYTLELAFAVPVLSLFLSVVSIYAFESFHFHLLICDLRLLSLLERRSQLLVQLFLVISLLRSQVLLERRDLRGVPDLCAEKLRHVFLVLWVVLMVLHDFESRLLAHLWVARERIHVFGLQDLGPDVAEGREVVEVSIADGEGHTLLKQETVWNFVLDQTLQVIDEAEAVVNLSLLTHLVQGCQQTPGVLRELNRADEHPSAFTGALSDAVDDLFLSIVKVDLGHDVTLVQVDLPLPGAQPVLLLVFLVLLSGKLGSMHHVFNLGVLHANAVATDVGLVK